ncbi:uncharacterized protein LOC561161 precursor [Danio rerio]|uniref:Hypothetical LOC561161 n=1 Tax=Danio rerio TaxID=7955 RepID=B3DFX3_DANRE|nr:uncharacterized protein LOC561161 precursor [Danio rerio]AAI62196.1 Hypothetical LOC561161 [Danio rerio]AAI62197.1 Hypothetical LOC561161 [Danio rerio]|eukprot:NP_001129445.1 uncharacterized protein LOC561161 precursor [Danio rerio]
MISVWILSSLILSYTFGRPIFNNTSSGIHMEGFFNVTERNFTEYNKTNQIRHDLGHDPRIKLMSSSCLLPTCSLSNLGSSLQIGDEIAGDLVRDPMGIGKK